jgi:hypothetical protein
MGATRGRLAGVRDRRIRVSRTGHPHLASSERDTRAGERLLPVGLAADEWAVGRLAISALALRYLSFAALIVLAAVGFGWRVPVAFALSVAAFWLRLRVDARWPKRLYPNRLFVAADLLASGLIGGIVAGLIFGGVVTLLGSAIGVASSLSSIPLATKNADGERVPLTLEGSPAMAKALTLFGLLSPIILLAICVLLLASR